LRHALCAFRYLRHALCALLYALFTLVTLKLYINKKTLLKRYFKQMRSAYSLKVTLIVFCLIAFLGRLSSNLSAETLSSKEYTVGPEDVLDIRVWDNEDLNRTIEVSQVGTFTFPLIGKVHADGLSAFELENLIEKKLADGYIIAPQVTVDVKEYQSQKVFLLGEVKRPGSYVLKRKTHILELISKAGGFTDMAGRTIKIVRPKSPKQSGEQLSSGEEESEIITLDLDKFKADSAYDTFIVASGDHIYVNEVTRIFVIGEVERPGEYEWERGLTVRQVISLAGGPTQMAALKRTKIIRVINGKEQEIKVRMDDLITPDDIVKVPGRYF
jgi:polysaccharide export outer membrane protein